MSDATARGSSAQRGATFLILMLLVAASLTLMGGLLTDTSQANLRLTAQQARQSALREAAFAGVRWAGFAAEAQDAARGAGPSVPHSDDDWDEDSDADSGDPAAGAPGPAGVLQLERVRVAVESRRLQRGGTPALVVTTLVTSGAERLQLEATLRRGAAGYAIETFELRVLAQDR